MTSSQQESDFKTPEPLEERKLNNDFVRPQQPPHQPQQPAPPQQTQQQYPSAQSAAQQLHTSSRIGPPSSGYNSSAHQPHSRSTPTNYNPHPPPYSNPPHQPQHQQRYQQQMYQQQ